MEDYCIDLIEKELLQSAASSFKQNAYDLLTDKPTLLNIVMPGLWILGIEELCFMK